MANHTPENVVLSVSDRPAFVRKPVSSGHYSIVNGVERASERPPVVIAEKKSKISSGNLPFVLDPALDKRRQTIAGLTAVTMPELPAAVIEPEPVSQEPASSPETARPMRFSKPPAQRRRTVMGLDISAELAMLQEQRAEENRRHKALEDFLYDIENQPFVMQPRSGEVAWFVGAAFRSLDLDCDRICVLSAAKAVLGINECLPEGMRKEALAAVKAKVGDVVTTVSQIIWAGNVDMNGISDEQRARIERVADRIVSTLDDSVASLVNASAAREMYVTVMVVRALDILAGKNGLTIGGFYSLVTQGWMPVGIMNDGNFLVIAK